MGTLLSPSQECHPFSPLPLSHDLVVSAPIGSEKWAVFQGRLGKKQNNEFSGATYFDGSNLSVLDWDFVTIIDWIAIVLDMYPDEYKVGNGPSGPGARSWVKPVSGKYTHLNRFERGKKNSYFKIHADAHGVIMKDIKFNYNKMNGDRVYKNSRTIYHDRWWYVDPPPGASRFWFAADFMGDGKGYQCQRWLPEIYEDGCWIIKIGGSLHSPKCEYIRTDCKCETFSE